jgi:hypothetical protein
LAAAATHGLTNHADGSVMLTTSATAHEVRILPDEILADIFLRHDAAADVVRASTANKSYRQVVCNHRFLRRYRFVHPPPEFHHAETPHKSAPAASSLEQAADFTFSFLSTKPNKKR